MHRAPAGESFTRLIRYLIGLKLVKALLSPKYGVAFP